MPVYETEELPREKLEELRRKNVCAVCGARLNMYLGEGGKAFVACWDYLRTHHEGIEREASRYEKEGLASLNIPTRREIMEQEHGKEKTTALDKARLPMTGALTQPQAMHILKLVYPDVPEDQIIRTAILCRDFGLHPLMKEVYIIGFKNRRTGKTEYSSVLGINASRKMAADKKGAYSFLDDTPRAATHEEIVKQFGEDSEEEKDNLISICEVKGEKGNVASGFGLWPKFKPKYGEDGKKVYKSGEVVLVSNEPYATDKGNTKRNMSNIRSERQATDRLPGEAIPLRHLEVIDEAYAEVPDVGKVAAATGEIIEGEAKVIEEPEPEQEEMQGPTLEELKKVRDRVDAEITRREAKENISEETAVTEEPSPAPEPEPPPAKDETPITPQQLNKLDAMMKKTGVTLIQLGKCIKKDKGWKAEKLGELKCWQFNELMAAFEKGQEQPPPEN